MPDDAGHMMSGDAGLVFRLRFPRLPDDAAGRGSDLSGTGDVGPVIPGPGQEADGSEKEDKEDRECMIHGNMIRGNLHSFFFFAEKRKRPIPRTCSEAGRTDVFCRKTAGSAAFLTAVFYPGLFHIENVYNTIVYKY